jgi:Uncharacterized protein conserved in bacteria (DUF2141)
MSMIHPRMGMPPLLIGVTAYLVSSAALAEESSVHDENQNGKPDRGFMGRPEEGIGISTIIGVK